MRLLAEYRHARRDESVARRRRVLALRAMLATGLSQREIAHALGISQPAVSQQAKAAVMTGSESLLEAAAPVLKELAAERGFTDLAVFESVARAQSRPDSDIDLLVRPPPGATIGDLTGLQALFAKVLGRSVDLVSYGGLKPGLDDDVLREAVPL